MTRLEFFLKLREGLQKLPPEEVESAVSYYTEYLDDAEDEQRAIDELGEPAKIAQQILAEYMVRDIVAQDSPGDKRAGQGAAYYRPGSTQPRKAKSGLSSVWIALLAIFASPIALPLCIAVASIGFAMVAVVLSIFLSLFFTALFLIAGGLLLIIMAACTFTVHPPTAIAAIGAGLCCIAVGLALIPFCIWLMRITFMGIAKLISRFVIRRSVR